MHLVPQRPLTPWSERTGVQLSDAFLMLHHWFWFLHEEKLNIPIRVDLQLARAQRGGGSAGRLSRLRPQV